MPIDDFHEWYDIPPTISQYYRDRYQCPCPNKKCNLDQDSEKHGTLPGYQAGKCRCEPCRDVRRQYNNNRKKLILPDDDPRHGTINGYYNWNCRCDDCKSARLEQADIKKQDNLPEGDDRHGTVAGYTIHGCRCYDCKKSYNNWQKEYRKRKVMASQDNDFGLSKREQAEISGKALAEHIWEQMENILAPEGFALQRKQHTITELEQRFPDHKIMVDEDDDEPYVSHKIGPWEARYYNGPYIDIHHQRHGCLDCIHVGYDGPDNEGKLHKLSQDEFHQDLQNWVDEHGEEYQRHYGSKVAANSCIMCGTPLNYLMDKYCPICMQTSLESNQDWYDQGNPNHPEARPFQKPHDFSGNE